MGMMILGRAIKHTIEIRPSSNMGFLVYIGCGMFVADSKVSLIAQLERYLDNPEMYEKEYAKECNEEPPATPEEALERGPNTIE